MCALLCVCVYVRLVSVCYCVCVQTAEIMIERGGGTRKVANEIDVIMIIEAYPQEGNYSSDTICSLIMYSEKLKIKYKTPESLFEF